MSVEYTIISIGALGRNMLWNEAADVRLQHLTTTLVCDGQYRLLVDPSLPREVLLARLYERTGLKPGDISAIFCTTLRPDARRGIEAFENIPWYCGETEKEWYSQKLIALQDSAQRLSPEDAANITAELDIVDKFMAAPDKFAPQVSLYPMAGVTPGCCGLLLTPNTSTAVITGPAVPTRNHMERGMVWEECLDLEEALKAMSELYELADIIIPGFDNICFSPGRMF
ncbi:MAG TPA: hypothetical protein PKK48_09115 [Phycisphaerae bacterium]|nr:hypothetical protein [Phycisphaerae bacterium]